MFGLFETKKKVLDNDLVKGVASKYRVDIKGWNFKNRKLILEVDLVDRYEGGSTDKMIKDLQKTGLVNNIIAIDPRGNFFRRYMFTPDAQHAPNNVCERGNIHENEKVRNAYFQEQGIKELF